MAGRRAARPARVARPSVVHPLKTCPTCARTFASTGPAHRYCSPACRASEQPGYERARRAAVQGGPPRRKGPAPDVERLAALRAAAAALRAEGLTLARIGERLGLTRQRVHQLLATLR